MTAPGVLFGETLFETTRVRQGRFFKLAAHLERMEKGIKALGWGDPVDAAVIRAGLQALLRTDGLADADELRVRITALRLDDEGAIECFIHALPYAPPSRKQHATGVDAIVSTVRIDGAAPWINFKTGQRLPHRLAKAEAERAGAWEGILLNTDGMIVDGTITNVHFVVAGRIVTPHHRCGALPGIAQRAMREIADDEGILWEFGEYPPAIAGQATEAFLTNALIGLMPLVRVDGAAIGDGKPGPVTKRLATAYSKIVAQQLRPPE